MRYAILSDIHANKPALKSVLADIASNRIDEIICLGDVVGYGPNPAEVLEIAYSKIHHFILGNHDAVIAGKLTADNFNDNAKRLIEWTHNSLDSKAVKFFSSLSLDATGDNFRCAHGEFANPGRFGYILESEEAVESFEACLEQLMFVGHSHVPGLFVIGNSKIPHWVDPVDFGIEDEKRYIVNVGSVGQPRDNDIRACYCVFDTAKKDIHFKKVAFDIDDYVSEQKKTKLPGPSSYFVDIYNKQAPRPIRDIIDFHRISADKSVKSEVKTVSLQETVRRLRKTRTKLLILLLFLACIASSLGFFYLNKKKEAEKAAISAEEAKLLADLAATDLSAMKKEVQKFQKTVIKSKTPSFIPSSLLKKDIELLKMPDSPGNISEENPLSGWTIVLSDPEKQKIRTELSDDKKNDAQVLFRITSADPIDFYIYGPEVGAEKGMRFSASAQLKREKLESGYVELLLEQELSNGSKKILANNIPDEIKKSENWTRRTSITLGKNNSISERGKVRYAVHGQFSGEILIRKCSLKLIE